MSPFLQLPPELIEHILVDTVCSGAPNTVAAVAACCHLLHDLVHSIWRDLFLAVFDDPRPKKALKASSPALDVPVPLTYDWCNFTSRIAAANRLAAADPTCDFGALVDVVDTIVPIPQTRPLDPVPVQVQRRAIVFPPLLRERLLTSNNTSWLNDALAKGYPPLLAKRMLSYLDPEGPEYVRPEFEDTAAGNAFSKLTFLRGFIPTDTEEAAAAVEHRRARSMARTRVYNTKYLMPERAWGPFQPLDPTQPHVYIWHIDDLDYDPDASDSEDGNVHHGDGSYLLNFLSSRGVDFTDNRTYPTYLFPAPHRVVPDYAFLAAARYIMEANMREMFSLQPYRLPCKQAAADVGRDPTKIVEAMQSLELLRMGGAPGFWDIWRPEIPEEEEEEKDLPPPPADDKGKGKATSSDEVDGWDWAGVEGEWRRVVCWLDYRELLMHNVDIDAAGFSSDDVQETMRIFPMNLRVARYSRPPTPPVGADPQALIWRLPIIHVEGDSQGTDTDEISRRVIEGTVRMIGDGAVRWSMTSSEAAGLAPEWVTESVQVGDIGSAAGIIGLWTGAEHSSTDPLGPCWAWKVSS
ncbi:hypothetical protein B0H16DRAFT_1294731 [Mycena metata]|uniref:F-box domain-containing protein n=1 Tax=Mycena metata TaxID=1033252 RepID=A0AAD7P2W0_9AGAR|nr:hypothetical protein B0H16DRAFT_1294731 [Mycena metata]